MFKTLKVPIGLTIALFMSVLTIAVVLVMKSERDESVKVVVQEGTAALSNKMALQLAIVMERSPGDKALFSQIFQPLKAHQQVVQAILFDNNYQVISQVEHSSGLMLVKQTYLHLLMRCRSALPPMTILLLLTN